MTYRSRDDEMLEAMSESDQMLERWRNHSLFHQHAPKPRLDWLLLLALTLDLGLWVGLLAWWIWR